MAESKVIISKIQISEKALKSFLRKKNKLYSSLKNIDFFASLLYSCENDSGNVFLFNYNKEELFIAYWMDFPQDDKMQKIIHTLSYLTESKNSNTTGFVLICTPLPDVINAYQIEQNRFITFSKQQLKSDRIKKTADDFMQTFWSYGNKNHLEAPEKRLRKRNYFYKPLKTAYKRYLQHIKEVEKPQKIASATKKHPFYYEMPGYFSYDLRVYYNDPLIGTNIEIDGADAFSFGLNGFPADKNHYYEYRISKKNPDYHLLSRNKTGFTADFYIHKDIDPQSFTYLKSRSEAAYYKDKNYVYIKEKVSIGNLFDFRLKKISEADLATFEYLDFFYGKDKNYVFYKDRVIEINPNRFHLNRNGFIYDDKNIYHYGVKIDLDAQTFKVISCQSSVNPFIGPFVLEDKNGQYTYDKKTKELKKI